MFLRHLVSRPFTEDDRATFVSTYGPLIRGYFGVSMTYYAIMAVAHWLTLSGTARDVMVTTAAVASIGAALALRAIRSPRNFLSLEAIVSSINLLVLINVMATLHVDYNEEKLVYFIMLVMTFALASVTMRQAVASIIVTIGAMFKELSKHEPEQIATYGFVAFAAATSAAAIAFFLRQTIELTSIARRQADRAREDAEARLAAAQTLSEEMRRQSHCDSLTGLPNRRAFFDVFEKARSKELNNGLWLICLDLDGFKAINDNYGHLIGDELLKAVAERLKRSCGSHAHVSRMGGDEFNVVLFDDVSQDDAEAWCERLLAALAEPYNVDARLVQISGSIGCYRSISDESDPIRKADFALLNAKRTGKNRVVIFRDEHARDAAERFHVEQALRAADNNREIELVFQPQIDLTTGKVVSAEALARWNSPALGIVSPSRFIQIAEESGLIANISLTVLDKLLAAFDDWDDPITISMNLSGHDLMSDYTIDRIVKHVAEARVPSRLIEFEITETAMMPDIQRATANLQRLSALGHPIALDDFGTGYSNFSYLRTLPIGKMKVDRSFVQNMGDPMTEKMLRSLVGMARTLNVNCVLEGIEDELELLLAKRVGAEQVQGFLFGQPMNQATFKEYLADRNHGDNGGDADTSPASRTGSRGA